MKKICKFLVLGFLVAMMTGCIGYTGLRYDPPIPTQDYFENVSFKLYIYSWEDFQKAVIFYFGEPQPGCVGFTIMRPSGERIVIIPQKKDGTINLETLGHEIFYHVIYDCDDSHKIPKKE